MGLAPPQTVRNLQTTLHAKAKNSPDYRFYTLYDKAYRSDVLTFAYRLCLANGGAPGVDGQTLDDIKAYGVRRSPCGHILALIATPITQGHELMAASPRPALRFQ